MPVFEVHITGQVQGVGFRPFIYKMALSQNLKGYVLNDLDGVHVRFSAKTFKLAEEIVEEWLSQVPSQAIINTINITPTNDQPYSDFKIIMSSQKGKVTQSPSPDFAICQDCVNEMSDPENRRYLYPFITCTNCGPRYSIMDGLPYDRELTSMDKFKQCSPCLTEYWDPFHRRFYSQTNSCHDCGIKMWMYNNQLEIISEDYRDIPEKIAELLSGGSIIAVKGIGGYLLLADASNEIAIRNLRERKRRPTKPFALMYPNIQRVAEDFVITETEKSLLTSTVAPILLLASKEKKQSIQSDIIAPGLDKMGVMLPYSGLFVLLFNYFPHPIIATSGNITNEPIIIDDGDAKSKIHQVADYLVVHNRPIRFAADDSVINTTKNKNGIIVRRSRGMAPSLQSNVAFQIPRTVLATGADLKSSFALHHLSRVYVSQYLGNQSYYDTQIRFENTLTSFLRMMRATPQEVLVDKHPEYATRRLGEQLSQEYSTEAIPIQHHKAHFSAVLAENQIPLEEKVLGVVWDGTGYGEDGQIWGGEFFDYQNQKIRRLVHFEYFDHFLGNKMPKLPGLCALSLVDDNLLAEDWVHPLFKESEWKIYSKIKKKINPLKTSSAGRLFDAVAGLLGLCDYNSYEGEAAMYLEVAARKWISQKGTPNGNYLYSWDGEGNVPIKRLINLIIQDLQETKSIEYIAAKFHLSLTKIIDKIARKRNYKHIAFSGGVFQNALLVDIMIELLSKKYCLYFHKELSPNDESIPFGQLAYHYHYNPKLIVEKFDTLSLTKNSALCV